MNVASEVAKVRSERRRLAAAAAEEVDRVKGPSRQRERIGRRSSEKRERERKTKRERGEGN